VTLIRSQTFVSVVGAPRSGTTSLSAHLRDHPTISFSTVKEPHFFSRYDLRGIPEAQLRDEVERRYARPYFADAQVDAMLGDGSVTYLYTPEQMEPILRLWPDAKFIIALRDPFEMLPSLHRRLLYLGDETVENFEEAWRLSTYRARGERIPRSCVDARLLRYDEVGQFGKYVGRFFDAVGHDRCFVTLFDDLRDDAADVYRRMLAFLELPHDGRAQFGVHRPSHGFRYGWLQRFLKRPPVVTRGLLAGEKYRARLQTGSNKNNGGPVLQAVFGARKRLLRWNTVEAPKIALSQALQAEIRDTLHDDIACLERLIVRDLSSWLGRADSATSASVTPSVRRACG
jgi:hypothetical protein